MLRMRGWRRWNHAARGTRLPPKCFVSMRRTAASGWTTRGPRRTRASTAAGWGPSGPGAAEEAAGHRTRGGVVFRDDRAAAGGVLEGTAGFGFRHFDSPEVFAVGWFVFRRLQYELPKVA